MYGRFPPYVSIAQRHARAKRAMDKLRKKGEKIRPIEIEGRTIATTFWGKAWCNHLEGFSDYSNRLPRGRTYVRNGSVCHLDVAKGAINAIVSGSALYNIRVDIKPLAKNKWIELQAKCAGEIGSLLELLQGKISSNVMATVTNTSNGLFPSPKEINLSCDCPDSAYMCKHVAAALYGIGARLDHSPELLFLLRDIDLEDLISSKVGIATERFSSTIRATKQVKGNLSDIFNIDLDTEPNKPAKKAIKKSPSPKKPSQMKTASSSKKKTKAASEAKNITSEKTSSKTPKTITAASIKRLRKKWGLNKAQLAKLFEVSPTTVTNWEKQTGKLNLQDHNRERVNLVYDMEKSEAIEFLNSERS